MKQWLRTVAKIWLLVALFTTTLPAHAEATFSTLYAFSAMENGNNADGAYPTGLFAFDGMLYGTAQSGGDLGKGTIFSLLPNGTFTKTHNFTGNDGDMPESSVVRFSNGVFYGTTQVGGNNQLGTLYSTDSAGNVTVLHHFQGSDGSNPNSSPIEDGNHNLFGTTTFGGQHGFGTIFELTAGGEFRTLHDFTGADGKRPLGLTLHPNGNIYGVALEGGEYGYGTVFKLSPEGTLTTLHAFTTLDYSKGSGANAEGAYPFATLQLAEDGSLIGAGQAGGVNGTGTLFKITSYDAFQVLYTFQALDGNGNNMDGWSPRSILLAKSGTIYGITLYGGAYGDGAIFSVTSKGVGKNLHSLHKGAGEGAGGQSLIKGTDGNLYGTTNFGGPNNMGTVFMLSGINLGYPATTLIIPNIEGRYGETKRLTAVLKSSVRGAKISEQNLHFLLDGVSVGDGTTNSKGRAQISYKIEEPLGLGAHVLTVVFDGSDADALASTRNTARLSVRSANTSIALNSVKGFYGQSVVLTGTLKRTTDGKRLVNQVLSFMVDGVQVGQGTTDQNGKATYNYLLDTQLSPGAHTLSVDFAGTSYYNAFSAVKSLTVMLSDSALTVGNGVASYGQTILLRATLKKRSDGRKFAQQSITFKVDGATIGQATTDAAGRATLKYKVDENLETGNHALRVEFAGTNAVNPAVGNATLVVNPANTVLSVAPAVGKVGKTISLSGIIRRVTDEQGLSGKKVQFYIDGLLVGGKVSSAGGIVTLKYKIPTNMGAGSHLMWLSFAGNSHYLGSLSHTTVLVVKR